jgi:predicted outer membrane protein
MRRNTWFGAAALAAAAVAAAAPAGAQTAGGGGGASAGGQGTGQGVPGGGPPRAERKSDLPKGLEAALQQLHAANQSDQLAAQRAIRDAGSQAVKDLAATLSRDHQRADDALVQVMRRHGLEPEGKAFLDELKARGDRADKALGAKGGFDRAFATMVIEDARKDVDERLPAWIREARDAGATDVASALEQARAQDRHDLQLAERADPEAARLARSRGGSGTAGTGSGGEAGSSAAKSSGSSAPSGSGGVDVPGPKGATRGGAGGGPGSSGASGPGGGTGGAGGGVGGGGAGGGGQ